MIKIKVYTHCDEILGIEMTGHALYAEEGQDIVCAGASALIYTLLNSMKALLDIDNTCEISSGYVKYLLPKDIDSDKFRDAQLIFKTIILGYKNMKDSYKSYIQVFEEEV